MLVRKMSAKEYHELDRCSASELRAMSKGPLHYHHSVNTQHRISDAMVLGDLVHSLLTGEELNAVVAPEGVDKRTKEGKEWYKVNEASGKQVIAAKSKTQAEEMVEVLMGVDIFRQAWMHQSAIKELTIIWDLDGRPCKSRLDAAIFELGLILDVKTTSGGVDAKSFSSTVKAYGYDMQAAFYTDAMMGETGLPWQFGFVVIGSGKPYEVGLYLMDEAQLQRGREKYMSALDRYDEYKELAKRPYSELQKNAQFTNLLEGLINEQ